MAEQKENRVLLYEDEMRAKFMEGAKAGYDAVATTYGPKGKNVLLERGFGRPSYTRDGVTVIEQVFFSDRAKNMGTQALAEASRAANNVSGDGSSATVILAYQLLRQAVLAVAAGQHPMDVSDTITKDGYVLLEALKSLAVPVKDAQLKDVATVSAGNPLVGELIADAILYVGQDGGILTEKAPITEIEREYVDGYYLQSGFTALGGKRELNEPLVVVSNKRITSSADIFDILNTIDGMVNPNPDEKKVLRVLFVGNFEDSAYTTVVNSINAGQIDAIIIKTPPMYGEYGKHLLSDIALFAGCQMITESTSINQFNESYVGTIHKVVATKSESTIFNNYETDKNGKTILPEDIQVRIAEIKEQLATEEVAAIAEKLRDRIAKLEGKVALFKIGAANDSAREELSDRIEDAINSTRHAYAEGIVAGGGVTWLELSKLDVSDITKKALRSTFQQLLINANYQVELKLDEALKAKKGMGYNLRVSDELVDVIKAGVSDPYVVAREVVSNATGAAANAIKTGMAVIFSDTIK